MSFFSEAGYLWKTAFVRCSYAFLSNYLLNAAEHLSLASKTFAVVYLISHGIIKAALVIGLLRNQYWAYPASLIVLWLYVIYQLYRFSVTLSIGMAMLTVFDLVVIWLIWHEYKIVKSARETELR